MSCSEHAYTILLVEEVAAVCLWPRFEEESLVGSPRVSEGVTRQVACEDVILDSDEGDLSKVNRASLLTNLVAIECIVRKGGCELVNLVD